MRTWLITGASRGFGLRVAEEALGRGDRVIATARNVDGLGDKLGAGPDRVLPLSLDVTDDAAAAAVVAAGVEAYGGIDVLLNNAGYGLLGAVEETSDAAARAVFDVNVFGLLTVSRAVLPTMRRQRAGTIINMGSVASRSSTAGWGVYAATKFAVAALGDALRAEAGPLGIRVTTVEPGRFRTDFLDPSSLTAEGTAIADYAGTAGATRDWARESNHLQPGDPARAAAVICDLAAAGSPPARLPLGRDCLDRFHEVLQKQEQELAEWREVSLSTDFDS